MTFDDARPQIPDGALYIDRDGVIVAVSAAADPPPPGFEAANRVETGADAVVYPGLIDLHNHIAYNCLSLWIAPDRTQPWTARDQWPLDPDYLPSITLPVNALCAANGKAVLKYVECKAVVGGVTAIQGSSKVGRPFEGWMVRNVEYETFGTGVVRVRQAVFPLTEEREFRKLRRQLDAGDAFVYHLSEGTDPVLRADYDAIGGHDCLAPRFVGIHCTALGDAQFADWHPRGGSIVWSPFSNLWLYGATTDIAAARARGMRICLGSDWSPSGSKNLLGELKVADLYNRSSLGGLLSDEEICRMVTCNPADALGWEDRLGRLRAGCRGDFVVLERREDDVHRNLLLALERDVRLVAINGYPMYGVGELMAAGGGGQPGADRGRTGAAAHDLAARRSHRGRRHELAGGARRARARARGCRRRAAGGDRAGRRRGRAPADGARQALGHAGRDGPARRRPGRGTDRAAGLTRARRGDLRGDRSRRHPRRPVERAARLLGALSTLRGNQPAGAALAAAGLFAPGMVAPPLPAGAVAPPVGSDEPVVAAGGAVVAAG